MPFNIYKRLRLSIGLFTLITFIINIFVFIKASKIPISTTYFITFQTYTDITFTLFLYAISIWVYLWIFGLIFKKYQSKFNKKHILIYFIIACVLPLGMYSHILFR